MTNPVQEVNGSLKQLQEGFLEILPVIERSARFAFRLWKRFHDREDAVAETIAICWRWYLRLIDRGKNPAQFPSALAVFAARQVKSGRGVCGQEDAKDVFSPTAQVRKGFRVETIPQVSTLETNSWQEALIDNMQSPVPEQVVFRLDFPLWLKTLDSRNREITQVMMLGHRTEELAASFVISPARVSQLRREFHQSWEVFGSEKLEQNGSNGHAGRGSKSTNGSDSIELRFLPAGSRNGMYSSGPF